MKQIICIAAFIALFSANTQVSAQNSQKFYIGTGAGLTLMSGFNAYSTFGYVFKNNLVIEGDFKIVNRFVKTREADYFGSVGNYSRFDGFSASLGKFIETRNGFTVISAGVSVGEETYGKGGRILLIPGGTRVDKSVGLGMQLSFRHVLKITNSFGLELRESYNYSKHFSGFQVSGGLVLGNF